MRANGEGDDWRETVEDEAVHDDARDSAPSGVCFDTSALIDLADAGLLEAVAAWFPPGSCHTAKDVISKDLQPKLATHPENKAIIEAPWLNIAAASEAVFEAWGEFRQLLGCRADRNEGEAEVLALSLEHGWAVVTNDKQARKIAGMNDIPALCTPELFVVAAAHDIVTVSDGWAMHQAVHQDQERAPMKLGTTSAFEAVFHGAVAEIVSLLRQLHDVAWPMSLGHLPRLDTHVERLADAAGIPRERRGRRLPGLALPVEG